MKKFFEGDFLNKKKVLDFLDKKGFYIVLLLCVGIITITAYTVTKRNLSSYMESADLNQLNPPITKPDTRINLPAPKVTTKPMEKKTNEPKSKVVPASKPSVSQSKLTVKPTITIQQTNMIKPVSGNVMQDYTKTSLVYSKTLDEWTTHNGIDFAADSDTPVKAVLGGTVSDVYNDTMHGITIILDHGNGIKTKYSNLSTDSMVKKGQKVEKGTVISGVGNTAIAESDEPPHLHFEVLQNGVSVNPRDFMKQ